MLKATHSQPASNALFSLLCFEHFLCSLFCRVSWKMSERERWREEKAKNDTKAKRGRKIDFHWKTMRLFMCLLPTTHSLLFVRAYIEKVAVRRHKTHTVVFIFAFYSPLSALLLSTAFFILNFLNAIALEVATDCCTDFISFSPVSDHHHHHHGFIYYGSAKGATGYWRWRQSSKLHNRLLLIHC